MAMFNEFHNRKTTDGIAPKAFAAQSISSDAERTPSVPVAIATAKPADAVATTPETVDTKLWFRLKQQIHNNILDQMNLAIIDKVSAEDLRREISTLSVQQLQQDGISLGSDTFKQLVVELIDEVMGLGPLEPLLADQSISDILVNGPDNVYVERKGVLERAPTQFHDEKHLLRVIDKIVSRMGRRIDESQPWVDARLPDGSRVNAIIRPCAIDGPSLSIRKFSADKLTLEKLVGFGALNEQAAEFLRAAVGARMNILISGGTGSGKTTMLNALSSHVDPRQRIVTIEDAAELQLQQDHVVRLETRPANTEGVGEISQRLLVRNALRMRPDRIIIGEVRGSEAFDMLQAMNTGHDGSMTTIHANTARDAVSRLEQMVVMIGAEMPLSAVRNQVVSGINLVLQLNRLSDGSRKVTSISELTGLEGDTVLQQEIFKFRRIGLDAEGRVEGHFGATGVRPQSAETLRAAGYDLPVETFSALMSGGAR